MKLGLKQITNVVLFLTFSVCVAFISPVQAEFQYGILKKRIISVKLSGCGSTPEYSTSHYFKNETIANFCFPKPVNELACQVSLHVRSARTRKALSNEKILVSGVACSPQCFARKLKTLRTSRSGIARFSFPGGTNFDRISIHLAPWSQGGWIDFAHESDATCSEN